ncbi:5-oxoprolinase subunit C family protein [Priestia endophytica]|jgi:antagonist of KipI|uniref:Antagonist of KipI n=1 Tax=Priestia endophytica DSM 13796 TaxID=1121089 RepID=A0A1I6B534_9BACI|nr:biotin-dependent carboxyltransferase family protein [Priestia endophytica]KYG26783.1 KipI antagonist [Priestia endophytica]MBG9812971.1 KipI antagonist [Priestia endophytica]SFQ76026.1 antagonist of KipI [Priestia endophytica DSM 13796]
MSLRVIKQGLLTSVQDLGRRGFQKYGVIVSGAMDSYSLRIANLLVGNDENEAGLEITLMGPLLQVEKDCVVAITGGDLSPAVNGEAIPMWKPIFVKKGSTIKFGQCKRGCRAYLTIKGGFQLEKVLESKSTYLRGEIGGFKGRALKEGDELHFAHVLNERPSFLSQNIGEGAITSQWSVHYEKFVPIANNDSIRVVHGSQFDFFSSKSQQEFTEKPFKVSTQSDRMGYRMEGPSLQLKEAKELLSEAVSQGSIQVPPDGNPIILLADRQTTGGYPKIAQVITTDLPLIAQKKPGESVTFTYVSLKEAEKLYLEKEQELYKLKMGILLASKRLE